MQTRRRCRLFICAGLLTAALSGCGGSSSNEHIPSTVSIFYEHSVLLKNGSTYTMGYNGFGQLGDGTLTQREIAVPVPGMEQMLQATAGNAHTMVTNGSDLYSWGYNLYGQLGNKDASTTYPDSYKSSPVKVTFDPAVAAVTDIAAGGYHSLAIADGKLYAWGYNFYRQLGNSLGTNSKVPLQITTGHEGEDLTALAPKKVAAGGLFSMALFGNGDVYVWGNNRNITKSDRINELVSFSTYSSVCSSPKKVIFPGTDKIEQIAALASAGLALQVQRDGSGKTTKQILWGWGHNDRGELGPNIEIGKSSTTPVQVWSVDVADDLSVEIKKIVTGTNHILLLMGSRGSLQNDGNWYVNAIGLNSAGQLGNGTTTSSSEMIRTLNSVGAPMADVSDIAAFGKTSFALVAGAWYGWGNNTMGQLGNTVDTKTGIPFFKTPVTVKFK
ncbi:RCC1 domain-containing protein [Geomonas subterranea]|uniref:Chromosome condensation regulator RCC1 n=1 Tax=Geomonas subterranea TaxID=2847989 RepID=A0ABX8LID8_9BACT|nr:MULTISPECIES: chromosome condensation regulator RCC1 [Geomonas]QXE90676.1 chromosome condensation regulator RCC1 [Geomonas subterranea]QXM11243.1 chromosome condensation regulator RCC1 [Geomonas subterranea]